MPAGIYKHKKGYKRPPFSEKWKRNISLSKKGLKMPPRTEQQRKNISLSKMGEKNPMYGKKITEEHKRIISEVNTGERHSNWKGGKETEKVRKAIIQNNRRARISRNGGIFDVDSWEMLKWVYDYICPCCLRREPEIQLTIDHIVPIYLGGKNELSNIQPLCKSCNCKKGRLSSTLYMYPLYEVRRAMEELK